MCLALGSRPTAALRTALESEGAGAPMPSTRVFVHIGPLKTGTTFLQSVLVQNKQALAVNGVLFPRQTYALQIKSTLDLLNKRMHLESRGNPGQWDTLAQEVRSWPGETVVISQEFMCAASAAQAKRMVESMAPAEVHIIHTARDFTKVIPAMWQTHLRNKQPLSWEEYITSVRNPSAGGAPWGKRLWRQQDPAQVLPPFETVVPRERVHVVTVPPAATSPELLWERFCSVIGLEPGAYDAEVPRANTSLGAAEAEVLRRVNQGVAGRIDGPSYSRLVKFMLARDVLEHSGNTIKLELPAQDYAWVTEKAQEIVEYLRRNEYEIAGDLKEILPGPGVTGSDTRPDDVDPVVVSEVASAALAEVLVASARGRGRGKRRGRGLRARPLAGQPGSKSVGPGSNRATSVLRRRMRRLRHR
jgi:hypothetical protein